MRNDSCRKCGGTLEINKRCPDCRNANEFFCHRCGFVTEEQIHSTCNLIYNNCKQLEILGSKATKKNY